MRLPMWVIRRHPDLGPDTYTVTRWTAGTPAEPPKRTEGLTTARELIPQQAMNLGASGARDPDVVEVWVQTCWAS